MQMTEGYKFMIRINTNTDSVVKRMSPADAPQTPDLLPLHIYLTKTAGVAVFLFYYYGASQVFMNFVLFLLGQLKNAVISFGTQK